MHIWSYVKQRKQAVNPYQVPVQQARVVVGLLSLLSFAWLCLAITLISSPGCFLRIAVIDKLCL